MKSVCCSTRKHDRFVSQHTRNTCNPNHSSKVEIGQRQSKRSGKARGKVSLAGLAKCWNKKNRSTRRNRRLENISDRVGLTCRGPEAFQRRKGGNDLEEREVVVDEDQIPQSKTSCTTSSDLGFRPRGFPRADISDEPSRRGRDSRA